MTLLLLGLILFLGSHSLRIFAEEWRKSLILKVGEKPFKAAYSIVSLLGFVLIIWGFVIARESPYVIWTAPAGMRHVTALLTLIAFVLLTAAKVPGNYFKSRWHHPMVLGVLLWAAGHLIANGLLAHLVLFGSFAAWALLDYFNARRLDRVNAVQYAEPDSGATIKTILIGAVVWAVFAFWAHGFLIGVKPLGV